MLTDGGTRESVASSHLDPLGGLGAWAGLMDLSLAQAKETSVRDGPFHGVKMGVHWGCALPHLTITLKPGLESKRFIYIYRHSSIVSLSKKKKKDANSDRNNWGGGWCLQTSVGLAVVSPLLGSDCICL